MSLIRFGYYYNTSTATIPAGDVQIFPLKKIHSEHPDFAKIDKRYVHMGFLKFEREVPFSSISRYTEHAAPVVFEAEPIAKTEEIVDLTENPVNENGELIINAEDILPNISEVNEIPEDAKLLEGVEIKGDEVQLNLTTVENEGTFVEPTEEQIKDLVEGNEVEMEEQKAPEETEKTPLTDEQVKKATEELKEKTQEIAKEHGGVEVKEKPSKKKKTTK